MFGLLSAGASLLGGGSTTGGESTGLGLLAPGPATSGADSGGGPITVTSSFGGAHKGTEIDTSAALIIGGAVVVAVFIYSLRKK